MKIILVLCSLLLLLFSNENIYSKEIKIKFENLKRNCIKDNFTTVLYKVNFDTLQIKVDSNPQNDRFLPLKLPNMLGSKDTAFFKEYFTGREQAAFSRETMFLVGNYKSDSTYIWVDLNCNLDFTDDKAFYIISKSNPIIYVTLTNSKNHEGKFVYEFEKEIIEDSTMKSRLKQYFYNDDASKGDISTEVDYWLANKRLNILSSDTIIDGKKIQLGLMDWNCNGLYNDIDTISEDSFGSDRILTGIYGSEYISYEPSQGAVLLASETLIPINGKIYKLLEIEASGKYIRIEETDKSYSILKVGDDFPSNLEFQLINGEKTDLKSQIIPGKYNLIDIWGFWCRGCILSIPNLKNLNNLYSNNFNIIGLHDYQSDKNTALKTIQKYEIDWTNGFLTGQIEKTLLSSGGFPYYVLIDKQGKIANFGISLSELETILKNDSK